MADVGDALAGILEAPPVPASGPAVSQFVGGTAELTRALSGMPHAPRPAEYGGKGSDEFAAAQRQWRAAARSAQRYARGERRPRLAGAVRERVQEAGAARQLAALYRDGGRMRLECRMRVGTPGTRRIEPTRLRELPAGGPGEFIPPEQLDEIVRALEDGDRGEAGAWLLAAFFESYGLDPDMVEVVEVIRLKLWPEGQAEPE